MWQPCTESEAWLNPNCFLPNQFTDISALDILPKHQIANTLDCKYVCLHLFMIVCFDFGIYLCADKISVCSFLWSNAISIYLFVGLSDFWNNWKYIWLLIHWISNIFGLRIHIIYNTSDCQYMWLPIFIINDILISKNIWIDKT